MRRVIGIAVGIVVAATVIIYRTKRNNAVDAEMTATMEHVVAAIRACPAYDKHHDFFTQHLSKAVDAAADDSYERGGRRRTASFDKARFVRDVFKGLETAAERLGKRDLELSLRETHIKVEKELGVAGP